MAECVGDFRKIDIEWCTVHDCPAHGCTIRQLEADILRLLAVAECACRVEWVNNPNSLTVVGKPGRWTPILCPRHSEAHVLRLLAGVEHLQQERDDLKEIAETCCKPALARVTVLEAVVARQRDNLKKYGTHSITCNLMTMPLQLVEVNHCSCGLDAALTQEPT